jgi:hypothetical protein
VWAQLGLAGVSDCQGLKVWRVSQQVTLSLGNSSHLRIIDLQG